jgi:hypothetical protein
MYKNSVRMILTYQEKKNATNMRTNLLSVTFSVCEEYNGIKLESNRSDLAVID